MRSNSDTVVTTDFEIQSAEIQSAEIQSAEIQSADIQSAEVFTSESAAKKVKSLKSN